MAEPERIIQHRMKKIIFATGNMNKLNEVRQILHEQYQILSLAELDFHEELAEDGDTFEDNARQKALFITEKFGLPCFAEDTGLEVDALNGAPGVYSARYAGTHRSHADNIKLLLKNLEGQTNRNARFKTVIALTLDKQIYYFEGTVNGRIAYQPFGNAGFGYDPVFIPDGYDQSFGELPAEVKNQISHRAIAVEKLLSFLQGK